MKIERLISIIMILLQHDKMSATNLAEMFQVTTRTIYRDIQIIEASGIPITTSMGRYGGISILDSYKIDKKLFSREDITNVLIGLNSLKSLPLQTSLSQTLAKFNDLLPSQQKQVDTTNSEQIVIDLKPWIHTHNFTTNFNLIKEAIATNNQIQFIYHARNYIESKREIEPYRLLLRNSHWYVQGFCKTKNDFRTFKLMRMTEVINSQITFQPRKLDESIFSQPINTSAPKETIKLLIDISLKEKVLEHCPEENFSKKNDKQYLVDFLFIPDEYGYSVLLSYGAKCICIEPIEVKNELIKRVENVLDLYR